MFYWSEIPQTTFCTNMFAKAFLCSAVIQAVPDKPVLVAGDPERIQEKLVEQNGSITYHVSIINAMVTKC